ncbi:MAG: hypothetical protein JW966_06115 [Anaerolineae bacterium]|nr:hypothetical protein [Anaerolineae bacterium]
MAQPAPSTRPKTTGSRTTLRQVLPAVIILLVLWIMLVGMSYAIWVTQQDKTFDFFPRWYGARKMLQGTNPYSVEVNKRTLELMDYAEYIPFKHNFAYLATVTYILLPFWLLPWDVAISLWCGMNLLLLLILPFTVFMQLGWRIKPWLLAVLTFFSSFLFRHSMHAYLFGQFLLFILACLIIAWWGISTNRSWVLVLALLGSTVRHEGALITAVVLLYLFLTQRYRIVFIWTAIMGSLFVLSLLQIGFWIPDFLDNMRGYRECCLYTYPPDTLGYAPLSPLFVIGVLGWGAWMLWQMRRLPDVTRVPWGLSVVIIVYLLVMTQSKDYTLVYGLLPAWMVVWASRGRWWSTLAILAILFSPWVYDSAGATLPKGNPLEQLLTPLFLGALLTVHWLEWRRQTDTSARNLPGAAPADG